MNLERLPAEKRAHFFSKLPPRASQAALFPSLKQAEKKLTSPTIEKALHQITAKGLCGHLQVEDFLRGQLRRNCRPNTIRSSARSIMLFLEHVKTRGCGNLSAISREHISGFVEAEQDRGMAARTVHSHLRGVYSFLRYLTEQEVVGADLLKHKLKIKLPDSLPRAIDPQDVQQMLSVIKTPRDKALILTLLRTGMRIGRAAGDKSSGSEPGRKEHSDF